MTIDTTQQTRHRRRRLIGTAAALGTALAMIFTTGAATAATPTTRDTASATCGPVTVAYVEVNSDDIGNAGRYTLADGSNAFDVAVIFAANINYDGAKAQLYFNENVQRTLDDAATIRALQRKGIKVTLSVLGNHQGAGLANFTSPEAAADFARQISDAVRTYRLDGVDLDDEWSEYGKNDTAQPNDQSIGWLITALRRNMPNKVISFYDIGPSSDALKKASPWVGRQLTYATNPYYGAYIPPQIPGLDRSRLGAAAVNIQGTPVELAASLAERTIDDGYGVYTTYNLPGDDRSAYVSAITEKLSGQSAVFSEEIAPNPLRRCRTILAAGSLYKFPVLPWQQGGFPVRPDSDG